MVQRASGDGAEADRTVQRAPRDGAETGRMVQRASGERSRNRQNGAASIGERSGNRQNGAASIRERDINRVNSKGEDQVMIMQDTVFFYEDVQGEEEPGVRITGAQHMGGLLQIPERLDKKTVTSIGKKAFWGCDSVREVIVPESVREIGDWAFASCKNLVTIRMHRRQMTLGRGVFRGCERLECMEIEELLLFDGGRGVGHLLAAGERLLHNPYLLDIANAGTGEWYAKLDAALYKLMQTAEDEGFSRMLLCGEEDYGSRENNIDHYRAEQRRRKGRAALLRLRYDDRLSAELRGELVSFLITHTMGCETCEAWEVLVEEHGENRGYYELFEAVGAIHEQNREQCIAALGETHTEMKAYLLGGMSKKEDDFFDSLLL